jgi:predicted porin
LGLAYTFGKLTTSIGYFHSVVKFSSSAKSTANIITVASEYKFNETFSVYAEYNNIATNTCDAALAYAKVCDNELVKNNRATAIMVGVKINF